MSEMKKTTHIPAGEPVVCPLWLYKNYRKVSNISHTLVGVDNSDVVITLKSLI